MSKTNVWETLSSIDVSKHIMQKGGLNYLSWAWAWGVLMEEFPDSDYRFEEPVFFENGTCEVWVEVSICGKSRKMFLPVMDFRNKSIQHPTSRDISDTRMRCLVKCLAMFGLGHYIFAGEDLPQARMPDKDQTISGQDVNPEKVEKAYAFFVKAIEADEDETVIAPKIQAAYARLTPDEQITVNNLLKGVKFGRRQMNTILKAFLDFQPELVA